MRDLVKTANNDNGMVSASDMLTAKIEIEFLLDRLEAFEKSLSGYMEA